MNETAGSGRIPRMPPLSGWPLVGWTALVVSRRAMTSREILFLTVVNAVFVSMMSRMFSSLLLAPAVTCIMALSFVSYPQNIDRSRTVMAPQARRAALARATAASISAADATGRSA